MTHRPRLRALMPRLCLLAVATLGMGACCATNMHALVPVPEKLQVVGPELARVHATGVQIYVCTADATGKLAWTLKGPDASFEDCKGMKGKHYAGPGGPTWEALDDHGAVIGKRMRDDTPDPNAIPWLLLSAADHKGTGILAEVTYIQRLYTSGGKAPGIGGAKAGDEIRVEYTADYVFYGKGATLKIAP